MPSFDLPSTIVADSDPASLSAAEMILLVIPSQSVRDNARWIRNSLVPGTLVVHATKGLERGSGKRVSQLLLDELPNVSQRDICVLSGPNLAPEIQRGLPAATVIAGSDSSKVRNAQRILHAPMFRVYGSSDLIGVELSGSLKNVVAISAGISDGIGLGDNAKAGIITRGLAEITRLGVAAGAEPMTFAGLAGIGDIMATCYSSLSRNYRTGVALGRGESVEQATINAGGVVEGLHATDAAITLARRLGIEMPIASALRSVLFDDATPAQVIQSLLQREPAAET